MTSAWRADVSRQMGPSAGVAAELQAVMGPFQTQLLSEPMSNIQFSKPSGIQPTRIESYLE